MEKEGACGRVYDTGVFEAIFQHSEVVACV